MTKVSYILNVHNKEDSIGQVIESLKNIKGNFRKEFIIVNDGSNDHSLEKIKHHSKDLPNTTIISRVTKGPTILANEGLFLATGKYLKLLDGESTLDPDSTLNLLECLENGNTNGNKFAFGLGEKHNSAKLQIIHNKHFKDDLVIKDPFVKLLCNKNTSLKSTLSSATLMIERELLEEISENDNEIYLQDFALPLRCASKSDFIFCSKTISHSIKKREVLKNTFTSKNQALDSILSLKNFIDFDPILSEKHKTEIYKCIVSSLWNQNKSDSNLLLKYLVSKIFPPKLSIIGLKEFIDKCLRKYF